MSFGFKKNIHKKTCNANSENYFLFREKKKKNQFESKIEPSSLNNFYYAFRAHNN